MIALGALFMTIGLGVLFGMVIGTVAVTLLLSFAAYALTVTGFLLAGFGIASRVIARRIPGPTGPGAADRPQDPVLLPGGGGGHEPRRWT